MKTKRRQQGRDREGADGIFAKGADVDAKNKNGDTPLKLAKEKGRGGMVDLLRKHGAKE